MRPRSGCVVFRFDPLIGEELIESMCREVTFLLDELTGIPNTSQKFNMGVYVGLHEPPVVLIAGDFGFLPAFFIFSEGLSFPVDLKWKIDPRNVFSGVLEQANLWSVNFPEAEIRERIAYKLSKGRIRGRIALPDIHLKFHFKDGFRQADIDALHPQLKSYGEANEIYVSEPFVHEGELYFHMDAYQRIDLDITNFLLSLFDLPKLKGRIECIEV